jgi:hypothetical protein
MSVKFLDAILPFVFIAIAFSGLLLLALTGH